VRLRGLKTHLIRVELVFHVLRVGLQGAIVGGQGRFVVVDRLGFLALVEVAAAFRSASEQQKYAAERRGCQLATLYHLHSGPGMGQNSIEYITGSERSQQARKAMSCF
jgi:hypothetical protein